MKTILIATDFSPAALNAANYAAEMALAIHADLYLLHIYQLPVSYSEVPVAYNIEELEHAAKNDMAVFRQKLLKGRTELPGVKTEVRLGVFMQELQAVCKQLSPYLVIMGCQGTSAAVRFLFGSHAVQAMKHLQWPLITVPLGAKFSAIKRIGLACDFNNVIDTTPIDEIKLLVEDFNAQLYVLNTGKEIVFDPNIIFQSGLLQEMLIDLKPQYHFIANENIDSGIINFAEINNIDLLVVLPKRHNLLNKLMHKSITKQLVLHSHVPVLALHQ